MEHDRPRVTRSAFPRLFWLAVFFEFVERGSYYGMMSVLSVYLTDTLHFSKPDVGVIKGTIQPLLYFLPILSGALADRFGYRRTLMVAFALLGGGYFLTSQATAYSAVFLSLVVVGLGAGAFKPIISGTIARCTDETNSSVGFGLYYWSINLGAFLVPLLLVPLLKNRFGGHWVILASAIGTGLMLLPTLLAFREPPAPREAAPAPRPGLLQTLANAFEIIYSPCVLLHHAARTTGGRVVIGVLLAGLLGVGGLRFATVPGVTQAVCAPGFQLGGVRLTARVQRNLGKPAGFTLKREGAAARLTLHDPDHLDRHAPALLAALRALPGARGVDEALLARLRAELQQRVSLRVSPAERGLLGSGWLLLTLERGVYHLRLRDRAAYAERRALVHEVLASKPGLAGLSLPELDELVARAGERSFLVLFLGLLLGGSLLVLGLARRFQAGTTASRAAVLLGTLAGIVLLLALLPHLSLFARILCGVIASTLLALYAIDTREIARYRDHLRFLLMIFIYSGFWVLYFQMFDSVLWYVQAYVDASSLDRAVNAALRAVGVQASWRFDVEHVTVINGGAIILLQLVVSSLVKKTRALPTMIVGICFATLGMAVLSLSSGIWVFILGVTIFSIGEMTAHPKFIAYVGQTAPRARVALYMGYVFLYGVIGSSIGSVVGANLYVTFVDELNRPRTLWLIFSGIGAATVVGLLLYNRFVAPAAPPPPATPAAE